MRRLLVLLIVLAAVVAGLVWAGSYDVGPLLITREGEHKMVLFLSSPISVRTEPGVSLRPPIPIVTEVKVFDSRLLYLNTTPSEVPTRDQERIVVDNYAVWRITDPEAFYRSFRGDRERAESRINDVVRAQVRAELGRRTIGDLLSAERAVIMGRITEDAAAELADAGLEIKDVRINRTDLPARTLQNVYERMRTERARLARKYRAEGEEQGTEIRAEADREARVIVAEAQRDADVLRGAGDAEAARIYAEAYGADPEFYDFVRSLDAYRKTIGAKTTLVLPPDSEFFRLFGSSAPE